MSNQTPEQRPAVQSTTRPIKPKPSTKKTNKVGLLITLVVVISLAATSLFFYRRYDELRNNPQVAANQQTESLVRDVGQLMDLPQSETPTIATVEDRQKLEDQPFFANVENGDKILIYTEARKAIIYRPDSQRIINVGPIAINEQLEADTESR